MAPDKASDFAVSFGRIEYINTLQFKPLHKTVLGLVSVTLQTLLDCSTAEVNVQDREVRTALTWTAMRDDIDSLKLLLEHGADANKSDNRGFSPIHSARSLPSLRLLLDHDANIISNTEVGTTPLHFVSRNGRHDMIESMVHAGADPNASDADDTPLIWSTYDHQPKSSETLLRLGANPNLLLMDQAIHGDSMTMNILSQARLVRVDPEAKDSLDKTAREYFEERSEQSAPYSVKDAFATLLDTVSARSDSQEDDGLFPEDFYDAIEDY
ncbi:MAG: hypothetical protein Q9161_003815 [Pseudevernia consocians]